MIRHKIFIILFLFLRAVSVECKTCHALDIRNNITELNKLRDCTEVIGFLRILLIEHSKDYEFDNYQFPELKRITGYLFFYNVLNLSSVRKLFPNLMVIRGYELFTDYALIIYNMPHLREIGTDKLMYIARGFVKVDKCPSLCYVNTIDWKRIGTKLDFRNVNNGTCEPCPTECDGFCWNSERCQIKEAYYCHEECLGCHEPNSEKHCWVCKNYNDHGICVAKCPTDGPEKKYKHTTSFNCVTENECRTMLNGSWWVYKDECVAECPLKYEKTVKNNKITCQYCGNNCLKWCEPNNPVDNLDRLQVLKGCTHINGSLVIRMTSVNLRNEQEFVKELFSGHLLSVRYIRDSLVIARTRTLESLNFLANVEEIAGKTLENGRFVILIYENKKLQKLWNEKNFTLKIGTGELGFFNNHLLCPKEIKSLMKLADKVSGETLTLVEYTNGDEFICDTNFHLNFTVTVNVTNATLQWSIPELPSDDSYVGFTVYYIAHKEGTVLENQNVCSDGGWTSHFTSGNSVFLNNLKAFTRYAYYVRTYQSSKSGVQTPVHYFTTLPSEPEEPGNFRVKVVDHQTLDLTWTRPYRTNGVLSHYQLYFVMESDRDILMERDYCAHPRTEEGEKIDTDEEQELEDKMAARRRIMNKCTCTAKKNIEILQEEISFLAWDHHLPVCDIKAQTKFGFDHCKNLFYKPQDEVIRNSKSDIFTVDKRSRIALKTVKKMKTSDNLLSIDHNLTKYTLNDLKHFTMYILYLTACNRGNKCGEIARRFARTKKSENADDIQAVEVRVENANVVVEWVEPKDPNGVIVSYHVEYNKEDLEHSKPRIECVSRYNRPVANQLSITHLPPGKYAVRVQAVSLAGPGRFSEPYNFTIAAPSDSSWTVALISLASIIALLVLILYMQYRRKRRISNLPLIQSINPDYAYVEDHWELDRSDVEYQEELGQGSFGMVYSGLIKSKNIPCAVKTVNDTSDINQCIEFFKEASIMKSFSDSHHVIRLLGIVSRGHPPLVVMELMERGDLKQYLRNYRDSSQNITVNEIYRMAIEIADGMAYLAAKKFVHRDLAARNCMVAGDRTVKVGDFGMARDVYETDYYRKETRSLLPVRWMAPESLADGVYTSDSDVWSYGIVLWEIATLAAQPYQGLMNEQVIQFVVSRGKLERPPECPDTLYEIMSACWCWRPNDRPTFMDIVERLEDNVGQDFKLVSFIHSREGLRYRINRGSERTYNPPALGMGALEHDLYEGRYNVSDEEVSLYVGDSSSHPRFLPASLSKRTSRFSPGDY